MTRKKEINRRQRVRYTLNSPMRYRILRESDVVSSGNGRILDMSGAGLRVSVDGVLSPGTTVEVVADWTGLYHGRERMRLLLISEVLRSDESSTVLRILRHEFRDSSVRVRPVSRPLGRAVA